MLAFSVYVCACVVRVFHVKYTAIEIQIVTKKTKTQKKRKSTEYFPNFTLNSFTEHGDTNV